ncbi:WD40/YVTN/BNR-like repeat-containing protein [Maribacter sp. 2307ULW6-5]|uniref:WD40/YVTN/BNR-like repeat-containing protein n=1 Tax=Maribacter sp. 2307ULW6-5 TaxID=3386275 RepID=UPI0039BCF2D3
MSKKKVVLHFFGPILFATLTLGCAGTPQMTKGFLPVEEVARFSEMEKSTISFSPQSFDNTALGNKAQLVHHIEHTGFHLYNAAAFVNPQKGVLVGGAGLRIGTTADGGLNWEELRLSRYANMLHSVALGKEGAFAVGETPFILKSDAELKNWKALPLKTLEGLGEGELTLYKIRFNGDIGFAAGVHSTYGAPQRPLLLKTVDGGVHWDVMATKGLEKDSTAISDISLPHPHTAFIVTQQGLAHKSVDGGSTWETVFTTASPGPPLNSIAFKDGKTGFLGGMGGQLHFTDDGGANWQRPPELKGTGHWNFSDLEYLPNGMLALTTAADDYDERPVFAFATDGNGGGGLHPLLSKQRPSIFFEGDSYDIFPVDTEHLMVVDRNNVYLVNTKNIVPKTNRKENK